MITKCPAPDIESGIRDFGFGDTPYHQFDPQKKGYLAATNIHFLGANGFPWRSYGFFLQEVGLRLQAGFSGYDARGSLSQHGPPSDEKGRDYGWSRCMDNLATYLEANRSGPVIGMGHSFGGSLQLHLASKRPELFKALILIDPASLTGLVAEWAFRFSTTAMKNRLGLIKSTLRRKNNWPNRDAFRDYLLQRALYKTFSNEALDAYVEEGLIEAGDHYELAYPPVWEAHNYRNVPPIWTALKRVQVPTLFIHAERSYLYRPEQIQARQHAFSSKVTCLEFTDSGHMIPQEAPERLAEVISEWLNSRGNA